MEYKIVWRNKGGKIMEKTFPNNRLRMLFLSRLIDKPTFDGIIKYIPALSNEDKKAVADYALY